MNKVSTIAEEIKKIPDGASIIIGGFAGVGSPLKCIEELVRQGQKYLTILSEVSTMPGGNFDLAPLFKNGQVKKFIGAHIGTSPELLEQYAKGNLEVELYPMGTWIEKLRAGGAGLGGILTPTGVGTLIEEGKQKINLDGKDYLLETALTADFAIIKGYQGDPIGNISYRGVSINCNKVAATAGKYTIAEVNEIVEMDVIEPIRVGTPSVFVNAVVQGNPLDVQHKIYNEQWNSIGILKHK